MNHVLITGGAGFIGTHLAKSLVARGSRVISLDLKNPKTEVPGVNYYLGDARDHALVLKLVKLETIDTIYHLAGTVSVPLCQLDPVESYSHNVTATEAVLEAARNCGHEVRVAFASSAALYGSLGDHQTALSENKIADRFSSFYAAQKHASEKMIELYHDYFKVPAMIFRFFNVYGIGQDPASPYSGVITIFTKLAREKKPIQVFNSGVQTRDFISVGELTDSIASAMDLPATQWNGTVVNLGSGKTTTIRELAEMIRKIAGSDAPILNLPPREGDVLHSLADISRAKELLKFCPSSDLSVKLGQMFENITVD